VSSRSTDSGSGARSVAVSHHGGNVLAVAHAVVGEHCTNNGAVHVGHAGMWSGRSGGNRVLGGGRGSCGHGWIVSIVVVDTRNNVYVLLKQVG
jgi:hypothetical protein